MDDILASVRRALHWVALVTTVLGVVALVILAFRMTGGIGPFLGALPFLAWAVLPFAFAFRRLQRTTGDVVRSILLAVVSGFGLAAYSEMLFFTKDHSSTEGLVFLFIPLYQLMGCGLVALLTKDRPRDDDETVG